MVTHSLAFGLLDSSTRRSAADAILAALDKGAIDIFSEAEALVDLAGSIDGALTLLEAVAEVDTTASLALMIGLYPIASRSREHSIADSIELWLFHEGTERIRRLIEELRGDKRLGQKAELWLRQNPWTGH